MIIVKAVGDSRKTLQLSTCSTNEESSDDQQRRTFSRTETYYASQHIQDQSGASGSFLSQSCHVHSIFHGVIQPQV